MRFKTDFSRSVEILMSQCEVFSPADELYAGMVSSLGSHAVHLSGSLTVRS